MSNKSKISRNDSLNYMNFKKKLDSMIHHCRKNEYKKLNEKRRSKTMAKSLDKSVERLSCPNINNSCFLRNKYSSNQSHVIKDQLSSMFENQSYLDHLKDDKNTSETRDFSLKMEKKEEFDKKDYLSENNRQIVAKDIDEFLDNERILENLRIDENDKNAIPKLKEIIYKLQLRDAVHRQKIIKLQTSLDIMRESFEKIHLENAKLVEINKQENKNSKNIANLLEAEKKKVSFLEKKLKKLDPIETAKLLEKLHEKNEDLQQENKKLEEMIKQLLLNREISRIRKLYPDILGKLNNTTPKKSSKNQESLIIKEEDNFEEYSENENVSSQISSNEKSHKNNSETNGNKSVLTTNINSKVKNVCLDLKDILKECKKN